MTAYRIIDWINQHRIVIPFFLEFDQGKGYSFPERRLIISQMLTGISLLRFGFSQNTIDPEQGIHHQKKFSGGMGGQARFPPLSYQCFCISYQYTKIMQFPFLCKIKQAQLKL
jgi:hypothetical protein